MQNTSLVFPDTLFPSAPREIQRAPQSQWQTLLTWESAGQVYCSMTESRRGKARADGGTGLGNGKRRSQGPQLDHMCMSVGGMDVCTTHVVACGLGECRLHVVVRGVDVGNLAKSLQKFFKGWLTAVTEVYWSLLCQALCQDMADSIWFNPYDIP